MVKVSPYFATSVLLIAGLWRHAADASNTATEHFRSPSVEKRQPQVTNRKSSGEVRDAHKARRRLKLPHWKGAPPKGKLPPTMSPTRRPTRPPTIKPTARPTRSPSLEPTQITPSPSYGIPTPAPTVTYFNASIAINMVSSITTTQVDDLLRGIWEPMSTNIVEQIASDMMLNLTTDDSGIDALTTIDCQDVNEGENCFRASAYVSGQSNGATTMGENRYSTRMLQEATQISKAIETEIENRGYEQLEESMEDLCEEDLICTLQAGRNIQQKSNGIYIGLGVGIFAGLVAAVAVLKNVSRRREQEDQIHVHFPVPLVPSDDEEILEVASIQSW